MSLPATQKDTIKPSLLTDDSIVETGSGCCSVEKEFVSYKIHYFLLNGAHVGVVPYLPVYAKAALGCSATTVGLLATCMQFSTTISKPLFGFLADCLNRMKLLIACLLCMEVALNLLMLVLPPVDGPTSEALLSRQGGSKTHASQKGKELGSMLRFAPARIYDVTVGLHFAQSRNRINETLDTNLSFSRHKDDVNSDSLVGFGGDITGTNQLLHVEQNAGTNHDAKVVGRRVSKCHVACGDLVPYAECYQPFHGCIDLQAVNLLSCTVLKRNEIPQCDGFQDTKNFSLAYHLKTVYSQKDIRIPSKLDLLPHSLTYYRKTHRRWRRYSCNVTSMYCSLQCERKTKFCAKEPDESHLYKTYQFWTFCVFALVGSMCQGALYTLSDTACYDRIRGTKSNFGQQRLWGAVGWGIVAPLTGFLNDWMTGNSIHEDYSSGWYIMAVLSVFFLINLYQMEFPPASKSESMFDDVKKIMTRRNFVLMQVNVFFLGILNAYATNYVIWYMEILGSTRMQMGLALAVDCLFGEAPFMYLSGWIISKLGHWHVVTLTFAAFGARFGAYYLISDPWMVLPIELLHGITFGLIYATITSYGELVSSAGTEATIQGILGGIYQGLGSGVGCLVAGISFDRYGGRRSFLLISIFSCCLALCHSALYLLCNPRKKERDLKKDFT